MTSHSIPATALAADGGVDAARRRVTFRSVRVGGDGQNRDALACALDGYNYTDVRAGRLP